ARNRGEGHGHRPRDQGGWDSGPRVDERRRLCLQPPLFRRARLSAARAAGGPRDLRASARDAGADAGAGECKAPPGGEGRRSASGCRRRHRAATGSRAMKVLYGARLFDGERLHDDRALVVDGGSIHALTPFEDRPRGPEQLDLGGGILSPGFVDWQINGGGGVLFNAEPTVEAIAAIAAAHRRAGVTAFLPTVVTDATRVLDEALAAAREARARVPGALGIHVEGPFIDMRRKGAHPPAFIRPMREEDADALIAARAGVMVLTLAPASVPIERIARLAKAGIVVSLGHSDASAEEALSVFDAGASAVTHLYNAMSQLHSRAPGVVGAALADKRVICGLIADGEHAHGLAYRAALAAKGARGIALVSDAMPSAAGGPDIFELQGR